MSSYDAWLEEPYQRAYAAQDAFIEWCEAEDVDPDDDDAYEQWEAAMEAAAEAYAEQKAEQMAEERYYDDYEPY